jgi:hypothetical protein
LPAHIDERLQRRARLPARLSDVVELLLGVIAAAHPRAHVSVARVHRHEARLEHGRLLFASHHAGGARLQLLHLTLDRLVRGGLEPGIHRGVHDEAV